MDIWGHKLIWHGITCHVSYYFFIRFFSFGTSHELHFCHDMLWQFDMPIKNLIFFLGGFYRQKCFNTIKHDVHVCVFTMMYMVVNCICSRYIKACIHQRLNARPHGNILKSKPPNHFKTLLTKMKEFNFIMFDMKLFKKFKF
jgi:hypothetical protein